MKVILQLIRNHKSVFSLAMIYVVMLVLLVSDRMLKMEDITAVNINWWISFVYSLFPWTLLSMVPVLFLGRHSRWIYCPLVVLFMILESVEWFVVREFGMILDGDWVGIVLGSSRREMLWFVRQYLGFKTLAVVLATCAIIWFSVKVVLLSRHIRVSRITIGFAMMFVFVFMYGNSMIDKRLKVFEDLKPVHLIADSVRNFKAYSVLAELKNNPQIPVGVKVDEKVDDVLCVFVLGESATRSHWGLYGYGRDTTPNMSRRKDELIVFDNLITPSPGTSNAMRYLFTTRTVERNDDLRYTMSQVLRKVGFDVALYSNQERWGETDGDETFIFAGCDPMIFMAEKGETNRYDEVLLRYYKEELNKKSSRQVVFLHLLGSHFPCNDKYPHAGAPFEPEKVKNYYAAYDPSIMQNHYDNSIWYTDQVLERIIQDLENIKRPCCMVYLSDHGETPSAKGWRTATDRNLWEVPFTVWVSPEFRMKYPDKVDSLETSKSRRLQSDQVLYGVLDLLGVSGLENQLSEDFLSESFLPREKYFILGGKDVYHW